MRYLINQENFDLCLDYFYLEINKTGRIARGVLNAKPSAVFESGLN